MIFKQKVTHRFLLVALDGAVYFLSYMLTNVLLYLLNLENNLNSILVTGLRFNVGLPFAILFLAFVNRRLYSLRPYLFWEELHQIVKAISVAIILIFTLLYLFQVNTIKTSVSITLLVFLLINPFFRYQYRSIMTRLGLLRTNVVIVGNGVQGRKFHQTVEEHRFTTYHVVGYLEEHGHTVYGGKVLGTVDQIQDVIKQYQIDEAVIAIPKATRSHFLSVMKLLEVKVKSIRFIPDMYGVLTFSPEITDFNRVLTVSASQGLLSSVKRFYKRLLDIALGLIGMFFLVPLFVMVFILVKLDDGGKVVFKQRRVGLKGKEIFIYKFRTMVPNAEQVLKELMEKDPNVKLEYEMNKKLENDPRITRIGNFLRKTSLDEFPQFLNVLKGDMSFVGPRPYLFGEIGDMGDKYETIIKIKPGVTGLWQASGRNEISFNQRVVLDEYYVRNWTVWFDIVIILQTLTSVIARKGVKG